MKRYSFWRTALTDYVQAASAEPFEWGRHDCALFAAGAVQVMTGEDFAASYRRKYQTLRGGLRLVKKSGVANHAEMAASLFEEVHPAQAMVGDVAAVEEDGAIALGIVQGELIYVLRPDAGITTVPLLRATRAFRVPFTD